MSTYTVNYTLGALNMQEPVIASGPEEAAREVQKLRYNRHLGFITNFRVGEEGTAREDMTSITLEAPE